MSKYKTVDDVIAKLVEVHGDKYDYSKVTLGKRITLVCPKHGEWTAARSDIFRGSGCKKCYHENKQRISTEHLVERFKHKWGNEYDYSLVEFVDWHIPVTIICPKHGITKVNPANHLHGAAPVCCKGDKGSAKRRHTKQMFVDAASNVHNNKYDYSEVEYNNQYDKVCIICPTHGKFYQSPSNHKQGHGCPKCASVYSNSSAEQKIFDWFPNAFERNNRKIIKPKELDLVSEAHKLAIEVNGAYWHSTKYLDKNYHLDKTNLAESAGYQLLHFWDFEIVEKPELVKSMIASKLGLSKRIMSRKCSIVALTNEQAARFVEENHLQGNCPSSIRYGLIHANTLVAIMTFGKSRFDKKYDWELIRFCCLQGYTVVGGASKLFKHFLNHHHGSVMSYANRRISNGNLYRSLGFNEVAVTQPNYFWLCSKTGVRHARQKCQKHKLASLLGDSFNPAETEYENMTRNGFVQCFDSGNIKYEYTL